MHLVVHVVILLHLFPTACSYWWWQIRFHRLLCSNCSAGCCCCCPSSSLPVVVIGTSNMSCVLRCKSGVGVLDALILRFSLDFKKDLLVPPGLKRGAWGIYHTGRSVSRRGKQCPRARKRAIYPTH